MQQSSMNHNFNLALIYNTASLTSVSQYSHCSIVIAVFHFDKRVNWVVISSSGLVYFVFPGRSVV